MPIVSLTSDFGFENYSVAVWKGKILDRNSEVNIVDISHHITPFNIAQAAYILDTAYKTFPENSIHCVNIFNNFDDPPCLLIFRENNHYFIGPDNGIFSLLFPDREQAVRKVTLREDIPFPAQSAFARITGHIMGDKSLDELGEPEDTIRERISLKPVTYEDEIRGSVVHVDRFGNVVINIEKQLFRSVGQNRSFSLYHKAREPIVSLSRRYGDVAVGDYLCRFNSSEYLEIAKHAGNAARELDFNLNETVQVVFENKEEDDDHPNSSNDLS